ncbi:hypothetical protein AAIH16_32960, partial [Pseudomonas aeruginosa]
KGGRFISTTLISATAPTLNYSKQITHSSMRPYLGIAKFLYGICAGAFAQKIRVGKINLLPLFPLFPLFPLLFHLR